MREAGGGANPKTKTTSEMIRKRRTYDAQFKARVALEAIHGIKTLQQIASDYGVHPVQVSRWKRSLIEQSAQAFDPKAAIARSADAFRMCHRSSLRLMLDLGWWSGVRVVRPGWVFSSPSHPA